MGGSRCASTRNRVALVGPSCGCCDAEGGGVMRTEVFASGLVLICWIFVVRGVVENFHMRGCSRIRAALRLLTLPLQQCTHRIPGCAQLKRRKHSAARLTCAAAPSVRSASLRADTAKRSRDSSADVVFTQELMASMHSRPLSSWVRALSARDFVTEFSGGGTPDECRGGSGSSRALSSRPNVSPASYRVAS